MKEIGFKFLFHATSKANFNGGDRILSFNKNKKNETWFVLLQKVAKLVLKSSFLANKGTFILLLKKVTLCFIFSSKTLKVVTNVNFPLESPAMQQWGLLLFNGYD